MLPVIAIGFLIGMSAGIAVAIAVCVPLGILVALVSSTADSIFKAYLYSYATGKSLPAQADRSAMAEAFTSR